MIPKKMLEGGIVGCDDVFVTAGFTSAFEVC